MAEPRKIVAVLFGGRSVEHEVSVLSGLQLLEALDPDRWQGLPVYVDPEGQWWTGEALRRRSLYPLDAAAKAALQPVTLPVGVPVGGRPVLLAPRKTVLGTKVEELPFDLLVPAIHGSHGEDGSLQGLLAFAGIPYAGCRPLGAAATMDKHFTKEALRARGFPVLPHLLVGRPAEGGLPDRARLLADLAGVGGFPLIVKPRRLGSSVGVAIARDADGLMAALLAAFRLDDAALVEPLVPDLVEYNIAVMRRGGAVATSAIERPLGAAGLLDFEAKYLAGAGGGPKLDEAPSEGMASLQRELDPAGLTPAQERTIRETAAAAFELFDLAGSVRVDFLCNGTTGELWLNEVNSIPGSFAWFLWQAAADKLSFTGLADAMIEEGFRLSRRDRGETGAEAGKARIFRRG